MRPLRIRTVLVATDLLPSSDAALDTGLRLARLAGAALHVVHVRDAAPASDEPTSPRDASTPRVEPALRRAGVAEKDATVHVATGPAAETIRALAELTSADVIVVGAHRPRDQGAPSGGLGGTARAIVLGASAPVLVAAVPLRLPLERVLVPVDLSDTARGALLVALSWAWALRAEERRTTLTALHVDDGRRDEWRGPAHGLEEELERIRESAERWAVVHVEGSTVTDHRPAAEVVASTARERASDLVVLGTRGIGLDDVSRLGSVSAAVVELAPAPMLLVPPSVWRDHAARP